MSLPKVELHFVSGGWNGETYLKIGDHRIDGVESVTIRAGVGNLPEVTVNMVAAQVDVYLDDASVSLTIEDIRKSQIGGPQ